MFDIGKRYNIKMIDDDQMSYSTYRVLAWDAPLLKAETSGGAEVVINTSSQVFVQAVVYEPSVYETRGILTL